MSRLLTDSIKKTQDIETAVGIVQDYIDGLFTIKTISGKSIRAINDTNLNVGVGDYVSILLSTPPTIVGLASFDRGGQKKIFI